MRLFSAMIDANSLWIGILRQAVMDCQAGDKNAKQWIIEYGVPVCRKLGLTSVAYYLLKVASGKDMPYLPKPKVRKTRSTIWQRHLEDVQTLMQNEPGISMSEIVRRLNVPRGRIVNCVKYLREN